MIVFTKSFLKKLSRLAVFFMLVNMIVLESYPALVYSQTTSTDSGDGNTASTTSTSPVLPISTSSEFSEVLEVGPPEIVPSAPISTSSVPVSVPLAPTSTAEVGPPEILSPPVPTSTTPVPTSTSVAVPTPNTVSSSSAAPSATAPSAATAEHPSDETITPSVPPPSSPETLSDIISGVGLLASPEVVAIPQEDETITVTAKTDVKKRRTTREGLSVLRGDTEERPSETLFFNEYGVKTESIVLNDFVVKEKDQKSKNFFDFLMPKKADETVLEVLEGTEVKQLQGVMEQKFRDRDIEVDVTSIKVVKKGSDILSQGFTKVKELLSGEKEIPPPEDQKINLQITREGEVKLAEARGVKGSDILEMEYSFGKLEKSFIASAVQANMDGSISVNDLLSFEARDEAKKIESGEMLKKAEDGREDEKLKEKENEPSPDSQLSTPAPQNSELLDYQPPTSSSQFPTSDSQLPVPAASSSEIEQSDNETVAPSPPVPVSEDEESKDNSSSSKDKSASIFKAALNFLKPLLLLPGVRDEDFSEVGLPKNLAIEQFNNQTIDRYLSASLLNSARAQTQSVEAFQVTMKAATKVGKQKFQVLPNGLVYLYNGDVIEAAAKPVFQYQEKGEWLDFTLLRARTGSFEEDELTTHIIKLETAEGADISLKYDFGLKDGKTIKKETFAVDSEKLVRVVWEVFLRPGTEANNELMLLREGDGIALSSARNDKIAELGDIVINTSDYKGNIKKETDLGNNIIRFYFEPNGKKGPLIIDPTFSVITNDQFVEIATPDFQSPNSANGWKIRFNRLKGGGIDQYFNNSVSLGVANIVSENAPLFNVAYTNSFPKDLSQTEAQVMEILERSDTRVRVRTVTILGGDMVEAIYTVYLAGQFFVDVSQTLADGGIANQNEVFRLAETYGAYQAGFALSDNVHKAAAIDGILADAALIPFSSGNIGAVGSFSDETEGYFEVSLGTNDSAFYNTGQTARNQFLLSLRGAEGDEAISTVLPKLAADFQTPDSLQPFTIGSSQGYNSKEGAYEMTASANHVQFFVNGSSTTRFQPVFKIANWTNKALAGVYAQLDDGTIVQDVDYILTFLNGDPETQTLIFQYLKDVNQNQRFFIDPVCTATGTGAWSTSFDCGTPGPGDDVVIGNGYTITYDSASSTIQSLVIQQGKLAFSTSTSRSLLVTGSSTSGYAIRVGNAAGTNDATFECRAGSNTTTTIMMNSSTTDAAFGLEVETDGFLDIQGWSPTLQNCVITAIDSANTSYIYLKDGSETLIKNADISYMGANVANKYGITAVDVEGNVANEGLVIENSAIHDGYRGVFVSGGNHFIVRDSAFYNFSSAGIQPDGAPSGVIVKNAFYPFNGGSARGIAFTNATFPGVITVIGNVIYGATGDGVSGARMNVYNNTVTNSTGDGLNLQSSTAKNNILTSNGDVGFELINNLDTFSYNNYYFGNTVTACRSNGGPACGDTVASGSGSNPLYVSTTGGNADFLYLSEDSPALAVGNDLFNTATSGTPTACQGTTVACINVGGRLDYVLNGQGDGVGGANADNDYNWLQSAHDDASLGAGDTVTAYANNVVSDTIHTTPNLSNVGQIGTAYYQVKFDLQNTDKITVSDQHEGFYAYFTSGANRGRYYLIIDSVQGVTDTLTLLSAQSSSTFTAGDGFTIVDRVYAREGGSTNASCTSTTEHLCITKAGTSTSDITWKGSGTVIIDGQRARQRGIYVVNHYQTIDGFVGANNTLYGTNSAFGVDYISVLNSTFADNGSGGTYDSGIFMDSSDGSKANNNVLLRNNKYGIALTNSAGLLRVLSNNIAAYNTSGGIYANTSNGAVINNTAYGNGGGGIQLNPGMLALGNISFGNTGIGLGTLFQSGNSTFINNISFRNTSHGFIAQSADNVKFFNNVSVGNGGNGINNYGATSDNNVFRNNILAYNTSKGFDEVGTGNVNTHNDYYLNGTAQGTLGTGEVTVDPKFYIETSSANNAISSATTSLLTIGSSAWTANAYQHYGLRVYGGSCAMSGSAANGKWYGIVRNSATTLYVEPAFDSATIANCSYEITNFYLQDDSTEAAVLGEGAYIHNGASITAGTKPSTEQVNMGARLGYINNNNGGAAIESNWLQAAHDNGATTFGDTITAYAVDYRTDTLGSTLADNGPYLTLDTTTEATIVTNDDYIGFYMYLTSGTNRGKYYLIIDSAENAGTDTISIAATDGASLNLTGFNPGDGFTIMDRVYDKDSGKAANQCTGTGTGIANLCITKDGTTTAPITWFASGRVIIDAESKRQNVIQLNDVDYNVLDGFDLQKSTSHGLYVHHTGTGAPQSAGDIFQNLEVHHAGADGVSLDSQSLSVLKNNYIYANIVRGIGATAAFQFNNTVFANTGLGMVVNGTQVGDADFTVGNVSFGNGSYGIDISPVSVVQNTETKGNTVFANNGNGINAVLDSSSSGNNYLGNTVVGNRGDGIRSQTTVANTARNNIVSQNTGDGIESTSAALAHTYNYYFGNSGFNYNQGGAQGTLSTGELSGTDPGFYKLASSTATGSNSNNPTSTLTDSTQSWTNNQFINYGLYVSGGSCAATTNSTKWYGIIGNSSTTLVVVPAFDAAPASGCSYYITDFSIASTSNATTPLGKGARANGTAAEVNMGAKLGYIANSDGTKHNTIQDAATSTTTGGGDTLTIYGIAEATSSASSTITDNGPYITIGAQNAGTITEDDQYIGMYLFMTSSTNASSSYLIIDTVSTTDAISLNVSSTTGFATGDTFSILDRIYDNKGWESGATSAIARFTRNGASTSSPIIWNASGTVVIDAKNEYNYGFFADTDGTDGLKYNNFNANATFGSIGLVRPTTSGLYQGGFGFASSSGLYHQDINWGGSTATSTIFRGVFTSRVIDMQATTTFGQIVWNQTTTSTNGVTIQLRSGLTSNLTGSFLGSDGTATSSYTTSTGSQIASVHNGDRYIQYQATLTTTNTRDIPALDSFAAGGEAEIVSSPFNSGGDGAVWNKLSWSETNGSCASPCLPSDADIRFQLRTAPASGTNPGTFTAWLGPDGADSYYTSASGTEVVASTTSDGVNDQWIQYRVILTQTGGQAPYLEQMALQFVINTPPAIVITSSTQTSTGTITVAYQISDAEEVPGGTAPDEGNVTTGLYYTRGATTTQAMGTTDTTIYVGSGSVFPSSGTILIDNEIISYTGATATTLTGVTRNTESSKVGAHSSGAEVWIKASSTSVTGDKGALSGISSASSSKAINWIVKNDLPGIYDSAFKIRVAGVDGNGSGQTGHGTGNAFTLDTTNPVITSLSIDANKTSSGSSTISLAATDNASTTIILSNNSNFSADGRNASSGSSIAYGTSFSWNLAADPGTAYLQVTDTKGNVATSSATTPTTPTAVMTIETSNILTAPPEYSLFVSWQPATSTMNPAFTRYEIYRQVDSGGYSLLDNTLTDRTVNFIRNTGLTASSTYDYYVVVVNASSSVSYRSAVVTGVADGTLNGTEGGAGNDTVAPIISNVATSSATDSGITVTFTTNELSDSFVEYSTDSSFNKSQGVPTMIASGTTHTVALIGLSTGATYNFRARSTDASGNMATSTAGTFRTTQDITAPAISFASGTDITSITQTGAVISFTTNEAATSSVSYGTSASYGATSTNANLNKGHTFILSGLTAGTTYHLKLNATDAANNTSSTGDISFNTSADVAAIIYNVNASSVSASSVAISWTTDEAASSQVQFSTSSDLTGSTSTPASPSDSVTSHSITLSGLTKGVRYFYRVKSTDAGSNQTTSPTYNFVAGDTEAPTISNVSVSQNDTDAVITWETDEDADSSVSYGGNASYGATSTSGILTRKHAIALSGLSKSTTYHYALTSADGLGNSTSTGDLSFATLAGRFQFETQTTGGGGGAVIIDTSDKDPAKITNFQVVKTTISAIELLWETNEPATTLAAFGKDGINDVRAVQTTLKDKVLKHSIIIDSLFPGITYKVQPIVIDKGGNVTQGTIVEATTRGIEIGKNIVEEEKSRDDETEPSEEGKKILSEQFEEFIRKLEVYLGPPVIVNVAVSDITDTSAVISWQTTIPAASVLDYGETAAYGTQVKLLNFDQKHKVSLANFKENTVYHYRVKGITESGQLVATQDLIFSTTERPKILNLSVNGIGEHSVTVSWDSNVPMTSEVEYSLASATGTEAIQRQGIDKLATAHKLFLSELKERTRYRIRVAGRDIASDPVLSGFIEFITSIDDKPPLIKDLTADGLLTKRDKVQVFVSWTTDEPATGQVFYEEGVERGRELKKKSPKDENFTTNHIIILTDFQPGGLYQIRVESLDSSGNKSVSEDYTILTPRKEENIIDIIVEQFQGAFGFLRKPSIR